MSHCNSCLQGMCRRHPLQDHGERARSIQSQLKESQKDTLKKSYNELIKAQIERLENEARGTSKEEVGSYREVMEAEREKAVKKKKRKLSQEEEHLARNTGLHSTVLSLMVSDDEGNDTESSSDSSIDHKKKSKKTKKSKHRKDSKKSKDKKHSKKYKSSKKRKRSSSSSS